MPSRFNTETAVIKTASVEVKTLTISGKQVTLAVFRQLQYEAIIVEQSNGLELSGVPWGKVNYHFDKCERHGEHLHIVWQKASELRRSVVSKEIPSWLVAQLAIEEEHSNLRRILMFIGYLLLTFVESGNLNVRTERARGLVRVLFNGNWWTFSEHSIAISQGYAEIWSALDGLARFLSGDFGFFMGDDYFGQYRGDNAKCVKALQEAIRKVIVESDLKDDLTSDPSASEFWSAAQRYEKSYYQSQRARTERIREYATLYSKLSSLDHLFIAV